MLHPFLVRHCKQGEVLPERESSLHQVHLPDVFKLHMEGVLKKICLIKKIVQRCVKSIVITF